MSPRLSFALNAAYIAGRSTLAFFNTGTQVEVKSDHSPVTAADKNAERIIRGMIREQYPNEAILGEEQGGADGHSTRWVIDPIDGTKSFVCGVPLYTTLLSFEEDGETTVGVAYLPALDEMVYAEKGSGAFWNGRPCRVSDRRTLDGAALSCGGHNSMRKFGRMDGFLNLARQSMTTRTWSDAYGHVLVATGRIEAMLDPIVNPWDISAMSLIVREAGGRFSGFDGNPKPVAEAISSNGHVHNLILESFKV